VPKSQPVHLADTSRRCPRCDSTNVSALPPTNPQSALTWFKCDSCDHMWAVQRSVTDRGN